MRVLTEILRTYYKRHDGFKDHKNLHSLFRCHIVEEFNKGIYDYIIAADESAERSNCIPSLIKQFLYIPSLTKQLLFTLLI